MFTIFLIVYFYFVTIYFIYVICFYLKHISICGRVLRRQTQVLVNFVGVSSILTGCKIFAFSDETRKKIAKNEPDAGLEPATSRLRACHSTD